MVGGSAVRTTDSFVGTWRDASHGSAAQGFAMFIAKTGSGYEATLYITESTGGCSIVRVPLIRVGDKLVSRGSNRTMLAIVQRSGGRIGVVGYDAPDEMVRTSTATNPIFE